MKTSIWQQFSSNHSSSFTVVGEFATREDAERAADQIHAMLETIVDWFEQQPDEIEEDNWLEHPSPPEKALAAQYNVEWNHGIDWFWDPKIEIVLDRLVFITPTDRPEADGQPFEQIMNRLGGKGYHEGDIYGDTTGWILFDLTCTAPDENAATRIYNQHLGINRRIKRDGTHMHFYQWRFDEHPHFTKLVENLTKRGFTEIEYSFEQFYLDRGLKLYGVDDLDVLIDILTKSDSGDKWAIPLLIRTFLDKWEERHFQDAVFLQAILDLGGKAQLVEKLIPYLQHPDWKLTNTIYLLGEIGDKRAIPPLVQLLETADERIKPTIQEALRKLGHPMT